MGIGACSRTIDGLKSKSLNDNKNNNNNKIKKQLNCDYDNATPLPKYTDGQKDLSLFLV